MLVETLFHLVHQILEFMVLMGFFVLVLGVRGYIFFDNKLKMLSLLSLVEILVGKKLRCQLLEEYGKSF